MIWLIFLQSRVLQANSFRLIFPLSNVTLSFFFINKHIVIFIVILNSYISNFCLDAMIWFFYFLFIDIKIASIFLCIAHMMINFLISHFKDLLNVFLKLFVYIYISRQERLGQFMFLLVMSFLPCPFLISPICWGWWDAIYSYFNMNFSTIRINILFQYYVIHIGSVVNYFFILSTHFSSNCLH